VASTQVISLRTATWHSSGILPAAATAASRTPGKLGVQHRGDQPGHEHAVRDPVPEHRMRGISGIEVKRVHAR
jgi:hypothetical protein